MQKKPKITYLQVFKEQLTLLNKLDRTITYEMREAFALLLENRELPPEFKDHELQGAWVGHREFHLRDTPKGKKPSELNDILVIYRWRDNRLELVAVATGSHDKLFSGSRSKKG